MKFKDFEMDKRSDSINKIEDQLFLGSFEGASDSALLKKLDITTVVTIMDDNIPNDRKAEGVTYLALIADDRTREDLLSHFHQTNSWITYGRSKGHGVLVHCQAGISRSATVMIAFLMNKYNMSFKDAKQLVRSKRPIVSPNEGFEYQLLLYQKMNYTLDPNKRQFRRFLMECLLFLELPKYSIDFYFLRRDYCSGLTRVKIGKAYMCQKCNAILFKDIHIIRFDSTEGQILKASKPCEDIYIEPQVWMKNSCQTLTKDNTILCPNLQCQAKLGSVQRIPNKKFGPNFLSYRCQCCYHQNIRCLYLKINPKIIRVE